MLRRERHAHSWPSLVRGAVLALPTMSSGERELIPQNERELRRSEGSGMLIGDPLGEGSSVSSTDNELWRARTHSSEWEGTQMLRRERHAHRWPSMVRGAVLALPTTSSGERRTHSSEWEGTQTPGRERHAHRWPSMVRGAVLALPMRSSGKRRTHSSEWEGT